MTTLSVDNIPVGSLPAKTLSTIAISWKNPKISNFPLNLDKSNVRFLLRNVKDSSNIFSLTTEFVR